MAGWKRHQVSWEAHPNLPFGWEDPSHLSHHHSLPGHALAGSRSQEWSWFLNPGIVTRSQTPACWPLFLKNSFIYFKVRVTHTHGERKRGLPCISWLSKYLQWLGLGQAKARGFFCVSKVGGRTQRLESFQGVLAENCIKVEQPGLELVPI